MPFLTPKPLSVRPRYVAIAVFGIGMMVFFQSSTLSETSDININIFHVILMFLYYATWIFLIKYINGAVDKLPEFKKIRVRQMLALLVTGSVIVLLHFIITNACYYPLRNLLTGRWDAPWNELIRIFPRAVLSRFIDFLVIASVLKIIGINKELSDKNLKLVHLESQLHQTHLTSLKAQLNPHFLFNSLHAVSTLIGYDDQKARNMTLKISGLLRKMLEDKDKHTHTFGEEMDYINDYLEIEQERFHDRLEIALQIDEATLGCEVPNLLLQPLVENAFKHGISQIEGTGVIRIISEIANDSAVRIVVENTNPGVVVEPSLGVGLENLKSRLDQLYGSAATMHVVPTDGNYRIELTIPIAS